MKSYWKFANVMVRDSIRCYHSPVAAYCGVHYRIETWQTVAVSNGVACCFQSIGEKEATYCREKNLFPKYVSLGIASSGLAVGVDFRWNAGEQNESRQRAGQTETKHFHN
jgi:hypothetical protein